MGNNMLNQTDAHQFGGAATQTGSRPGEFSCAGEDIKDLLADLTRQFIAADQRNTAALHDMRGRLETLGRDAESVRDQVPSQHAPAFARIEDSVQILADKIAAVGREREIAKAAASLAAVAASAPTAKPLDDMARSTAATFDATSMGEPGGVRPYWSERQEIAALESLPGDTAEPWSQASADALADLYESGDAHVGSRQPQPMEMPAPLAMPAALQTSSAAELPPVAPATRADQDWLDERFAAIAARIEQSLEAARPESALLALDGRLEQLERRFGDALQDLATRADVEGLRIVEAHLSELFAQFERTQGQLGRLDGIEQQLGDLMHQFSDERLGSLLALHAPAGRHTPSEEEIEAVAMAVADRVAGRLPHPEFAPAGIDHDAVAELQSVVDSFVAGQRENEEHTSTMLDTMQQAMIRMLDRMDALENAAPSYTPPPSSFAAAAAPAMPAAAPAPAAPQRVEPLFAADAPAPAVEAAAVLPNRGVPQSREDFRAAAAADARRAARKVATQSADPAAPPAEAVRPRRGAPAVEIAAPAAAPEDEVKARSRTPLMVAGIALLFAIGFLATSVGLNRGLSFDGGTHQTAQQKSPLAVDNGSAETTSGDLAADDKAAAPTPSITTGNATPRSSTAAAPQRPDGALYDQRNKADAAVEGLSDRREAPSEPAVERRDAALPTPSSLAAANAIGISVTPTNAVSTNTDLARMRRERNMASLASQLAAVQANGPTVPASLLPNGVVEAAAAEADAVKASGAANNSVMPPAQVGPTSLRIAAQKGDPSAEFEVAARFAEGRGIGQDFKQAQFWYQRSAQRGFAPAQYRLGTLFERGIGTKADVARAKIWYGRAAEQGHVKAMHNLAVLNAGREQSADYGTAVQWFTAAAERGLADSQFNLGVLYESGLGLPRDMKQAYHWLSLAARTGDKEAARRRDAVRMKLEEAEVAAADAAVNAWRAQAVDSQVNEPRAAGEAWKSRQAATR